MDKVQLRACKESPIIAFVAPATRSRAGQCARLASGNLVGYSSNARLRSRLATFFTRSELRMVGVAVGARFVVVAATKPTTGRAQGGEVDATVCGGVSGPVPRYQGSQ